MTLERARCGASAPSAPAGAAAAADHSATSTETYHTGQRNTQKLNFAAALLLASGALHAQNVEVRDAWVRSTVPGQKGTGAFMTLTAKEGTRLVGVRRRWRAWPRCTR